MAIPGTKDVTCVPSGTRNQETADPAKTTIHTRVIDLDKSPNISFQQIDQGK